MGWYSGQIINMVHHWAITQTIHTIKFYRAPKNFGWIIRSKCDDGWVLFVYSVSQANWIQPNQRVKRLNNKYNIYNIRCHCKSTHSLSFVLCEYNVSVCKCVAVISVHLWNKWEFIFNINIYSHLIDTRMNEPKEKKREGKTTNK